MLSLCLVSQRNMRVTPLGFYLRVIVNEKRLNLEKTISSVLPVLLLVYDAGILILRMVVWLAGGWGGVS